MQIVKIGGKKETLGNFTEKRERGSDISKVYLDTIIISIILLITQNLSSISNLISACSLQLRLIGDIMYDCFQEISC